MARRESKKEEIRENVELGSGQYPQKYVVPEPAMRDFVGSLSILHISTVAARFQIVADLTSGAFEERRDELDSADLSLLNRIAAEDNSEHHRRLMSAIIAGAGKGRHGINAAHLTASRVVELAFRCTREYFSALHAYRRNIRLKLLDRSQATHRGRRSVSNRS